MRGHTIALSKVRIVRGYDSTIQSARKFLTNDHLGIDS